MTLERGHSPHAFRTTPPAFIPPSMTSSVPVTYFEASDARYKTPAAISIACPARPSGVAILARSSGSIGAFCPSAAPAGILPQIGVSIMPGWTELTRMPSPNEAHSIAIALANSRTPPLVAQYPDNVAEPRHPAIDKVMTIEPLPGAVQFQLGPRMSGISASASPLRGPGEVAL